MMVEMMMMTVVVW